ncbi:ATP-dependent RNA helicase [Pestalotiopsis sp. IQ-011]
MTTFMSPLPLSATASIIASAWASGAGAAISLFTITPILASSAPRDVLLQQWHLAYTLGKSYMPPAAGAIAASYLGAAYYSPSEWRGFAAAAALTVGIVPFTLLLIMPTVRALEGMLGDGRDGKEAGEEARRVMRTWSRWNFARAMLPLVGTGFAVWNLGEILLA